MADKLNFIRYLSHFRCVHRGADFAKMRTTTVRRLLPESWGFLCPVHTPDGAPCGLLNHLTATCEVVTKFVYTASVPALLCGLGRTRDSPAGFAGFAQHQAAKSSFGIRQRIPFQSSMRESGCFLAFSCISGAKISKMSSVLIIEKM